MNFSTIWPNSMVFGRGALAQLPERVKQFGGTRVLIVTDPGLEACGLTQRISNVLAQAGLTSRVFAEVQPNPTMTEVRNGVALWQEGGFDVILALGGGSSMDATKVIVSALLSGRSIEELAVGVDDAKGTVIPFIALPTTSGTGSEATSAAMVKDDSGKKHLVRSFRCRPAVSILDPELTLSVPSRMTAATGIDALIHSLGAYTNKSVHPIADVLALQAMGLVMRWLPTAVESGNNIEARENMMLASYLSGVAIGCKGNDAIHGLSTPVESMLNVTHGESLAALLPHVVAFNIETNPEVYASIASHIGLGSGATASHGAQTFLQRITELRDTIGVSRELGSMGVKSDMFDRLSQMAVSSRSTTLNCRSMSQDDIRSIYAQAI